MHVLTTPTCSRPCCLLFPTRAQATNAMPSMLQPADGRASLPLAMHVGRAPSRHARPDQRVGLLPSGPQLPTRPRRAHASKFATACDHTRPGLQPQQARKRAPASCQGHAHVHGNLFCHTRPCMKLACSKDQHPRSATATSSFPNTPTTLRCQCHAAMPCGKPMLQPLVTHADP